MTLRTGEDTLTWKRRLWTCRQTEYWIIITPCKVLNINHSVIHPSNYTLHRHIWLNVHYPLRLHHYLWKWWDVQIITFRNAIRHTKHTIIVFFSLWHEKAVWSRWVYCSTKAGGPEGVGYCSTSSYRLCHPPTSYPTLGSATGVSEHIAART